MQRPFLRTSDRLRPSWLPPAPMTAARLALARHPRLTWGLVLVATAIAGSAVYGSVRAVDEQRQRWGSSVPVLVATRPLAPGEAIGGSLRTQRTPSAIAPDGALAAVPDGAVAAQHVDAGEALSGHDVSDGRGHGGLVPGDWRVVAVVEPIPSGVAVGTEVSVASDGAVLAGDGVVVGTHAEAVLVAVPPADAPAVAAAAVESRAALLLGD